jgi:hypothetical protein
VDLQRSKADTVVKIQHSVDGQRQLCLKVGGMDLHGS